MADSSSYCTPEAHFWRFLTFPVVGTFCTACGTLRPAKPGEPFTLDWLQKKWNSKK